MIPLVAENVEVPETEEAISLETENAEVFDDGQGPISEPEAEEGDHHGEVASSRAIDHQPPSPRRSSSLKSTTEGRSLGPTKNGL